MYERARDQIAKLRATNAKFATFLREREIGANGVMMPLENYLITPVQRIPRYELLLSALMSSTWKSHPDYQNLVEAHKMASQISEQVNDMKRQRENHDKMLQVYNLLTIGKKEHWDKQLLVEKKTRLFVREGMVTESMIKGEQTKFFALLFNDLLLWTKPKKNAYEFKASNDLKNAKVELKTGSNAESTIHLRCEGSMRVFKGETEEDTQKWYAALKSCVSNATPDGLQITSSTSTSSLDNGSARAMKSDKSNPSVSTSVLDKARASKLAKDERRKPRGIRSTQLKLTELRFLDDVERGKAERMGEQVTQIRQWQSQPDKAELARFEISAERVSSMFSAFPSDTYKAFYDMSQALSSLSLHTETPELVLLGRQGSGKTSLLCSILNYPLPLDDLKRPLFIHVITNHAFPPESPSIWIRKDYTQKPKITKDVHVSSPEQLSKELLKRASRDYSESPIHMFFEASHVLNCTLIDTPGLDAFQFHDEPLSGAPTARSVSNVTVRSLVYEVARHPHRQLFIVEECKHKGLMSSAAGLATVVDPNLSRSTFVCTKFHHELRDFWQHTQLNTYLQSMPSGTFFVTLPSADSLSAFNAGSQTQAQYEMLLAQAYIRDLDIMDMLQYDTKYAGQIGIHSFKRYVTQWVYRKHLQSIPHALEQLNSVTDRTVSQFATLKPRLSWTETRKLRSVANAFTYDVVKTLPEILFGSTQVEAKVHGQTLQEEKYKMDVPHAFWVDFYNQPIVSDVDTFESAIPYHNSKLYGSAQMIRLFSVFNAVVQVLQLRKVAPEDIAAVLGTTRSLHSKNHYLQAGLTLAHSKAESTLLPLVKQLCQRAGEMIKRLGAIATHIVSDDQRSSTTNAHGQYKHEMDIPLFAGHVRVLYEHYASQLAETCLEECAGLLDQVLIHDVSKFKMEDLDDSTPEKREKIITSLVAAMFNDISKLFVRNITAKCYDILVARGVEDIGMRLQADIAGLTEAQLQSLFDVGSFKLALEAEEKQLKAFDATLKSAHEAFTKAVRNFSDKTIKRANVSYKKLSLVESQTSSSSSAMTPTHANGTSSVSPSPSSTTPAQTKRPKTEEKSIKVTTAPAAPTTTVDTTSVASTTASPVITATAAATPTNTTPAAAAAAATPTPTPKSASSATPASADTQKPPVAEHKVEKKAEAPPTAEKKADSATPATTTTPLPTVVSPPVPTRPTRQLSSSPSPVPSSSASPPKPILTASEKQQHDASAVVEPLVKPSEKRGSVGTGSAANVFSPETSAAKEVIPANNAAQKKAAFEKSASPSAQQ